MLKTLLVSTLVFSAASPALADQVIARVKDKEFVMMTIDPMNPWRYFRCELKDSNFDGKVDVTEVSMILSGALGGQGLGLLQNSYITNEFRDTSGKICDKIRAIEDDTAMSFGALRGTFSSVLKKVDGKLIEDLTVIAGRTDGPESPRITLRARVEVLLK
ncbi:MAG: hypothetical protein V4692_08890 [Bdellovibrionota bacterium]